jgi:hypothetical protein
MSDEIEIIDDVLPHNHWALPRPAPRPLELTEDGLVRQGALLLTPEARGEMARVGRPSRAERSENDETLMRLSRLKNIQANLAVKLSKQLSKRVYILVHEIERIVQNPGQQFDGPRVSLINKLLDKLLPEVTLEDGAKHAAASRAPALQLVIQNVERGRMREARRVAPQATDTAAIDGDTISIPVDSAANL